MCLGVICVCVCVFDTTFYIHYWINFDLLKIKMILEVALEVDVFFLYVLYSYSYL